MARKKLTIVGAGFTGLAAAWYLNRRRFKITVVERDAKPGGMAGGWKKADWDWTLDKHYHHVFASDNKFKDLVKDLDLEHKLYYKRPVSNFFVDGRQISLMTSLKDPKSALALGKLKLIKNWEELEDKKAVSWLKDNMGKETFDKFWEPLFKGKFGRYQKRVSLAWFWARIKKRTFKLGYYEGGFQEMANRMVKILKRRGVKFKFNTEVTNVGKNPKGFQIITNKGRYNTDYVLVTTPMPTALDLVWFLPEKDKKKWGKINFLHAVTLNLVLNQPLLEKTYWLNISDSRFPFVSLVEHTNFIPSKRYNDKHIVYLGKYLTEKSPIWRMDKKKLLRLYEPFLKKINPDFKRDWIDDSKLFKTKFGQHVVRPRYFKKIPTIETAIPQLFLANITHIYPWDRGVNYAIELGQNAAEKIEASLKD